MPRATNAARKSRKTPDGDFPQVAPAPGGAVAEASLPAGSWGAVEMLGGAKVLRHKVDTSLDAHDLLMEGLPAKALDHLVDRVVLLHDPRKQTAAMLPAFLRYLKANGYKVVHVIPSSGRILATH